MCLLWGLNMQYYGLVALASNKSSAVLGVKMIGSQKTRSVAPKHEGLLIDPGLAGALRLEYAPQPNTRIVRNDDIHDNGNTTINNITELPTH